MMNDFTMTADIEINDKQTHVCWNLHTETRTVLDSYSCLCERSLRLVPNCSFFGRGTRMWNGRESNPWPCNHWS